MHPSTLRTPMSARALLHAAVVALLAVLGLVLLGAGPATAADNDVSWAVRTASNQFGADRQNYSYTLNPGGELSDAVVIVNHGKDPLELAVYAADGFTTDAGQLDLLTKDVTSTGVGAWVHASHPQVRIQPGESVRVPFTITLPRNATPGDHMGGIITSLSQPDAVQGINVDRRLAIRIRLRVGGELTPRLSVDDVHLDYSGTSVPFAKGDATLSYTVHNTGNAILAARQDVSVSGPFGRLRTAAGAVDDTPELLPGDTWHVSVPVHGVTPVLRLAGTVTLTPLLTDASGSVTPLAAVSGTTHDWTITSALLFLLICGLAVAAVVVLWRRRRQAQVREEARVQEAVEQALRERETSDR